jgi:hypothetical protein
MKIKKPHTYKDRLFTQAFFFYACIFTKLVLKMEIFNLCAICQNLRPYFFLLVRVFFFVNMFFEEAATFPVKRF